MVALAGIIILGIFAQWLAWKIKVPAILPLIIIGLLVGPLSTLWTEDGMKWISPMYSEDDDYGLFPGKSLFYFVSLAIGIILFEGGLTLKRREISGVGPVILKLISLGTAVTFAGASLGAYFIMGLTWQISMLFGALVIVTGPTVIAPILQNVPLTRNVATVLKWEGILIDPIGALIAVLVFEFIRSSGGNAELTLQTLGTFFKVIVVGISEGTLGAIVLYQLIKRDLIPAYLLNVFTLALVLLIFVASDELAHESGLLSVVIMGMVLGNLRLPSLKGILSFKESLSVLLISILFILLAAAMDMDDLQLLLEDWRALGLFAFVALGLRPLSVILSTRGSELNWREKLFISWVGPRGIVAAGIASLFGITLTLNGVEDAQYITPLVFMVVLGTVTLNATTARPVAGLLGVIQKSSDGVLIIGSNKAARVMAKYLHELGRHVVLIDRNLANVEKAKDLGIEAFQADIFQDDLSEQIELLDMGYMIALTSNPDVNDYAVRKYERIFGENGTFRLITTEEMGKDRDQLPQQGILSYSDDFLNFNEVARDYPEIQEVEIPGPESLEKSCKLAEEQRYCIPIFLKEPNGNLQVLPADLGEVKFDQEGTYKLVYLGKKMDALPATPLEQEEEVES